MNDAAPLTSRQRRALETRAAILEAAHGCFRELGFADCSLDRVASEAGFTKGAVYGLFDSKEALLLALIAERSASFLADSLAALPEHASEEVLIHTMAHWLARVVDEEREWTLVMAVFAVLAGRRPALAEQRRAALLHSKRELNAVLERFIPGVAEDPERAAISGLLLALADGLALQRLIDPELDVAAAFTLGARRMAKHSSATAPRGSRSGIRRG